MPVELTTIATPTWNSGDQDKHALKDSRASDGSPQALLFSATFPRKLTFQFANLPNVKLDALRAFVRAHLLPPTAFTYTNPIGGEVLTLMIEVKSVQSYQFSAPNKNSTSFNAWTV